MKSNPSDVGYLPAISDATLVVFALSWAAMHDIARGDGGLEYGVLGASLAGLALLGRYGMRCLEGKERLWWLSGTGVLVLLFNAGAVAGMAQPKYTADGTIGAVWLCAGVPALVLIGNQLRASAKRRTR